MTKGWLRSVGAVAGGFFVTAFASTAMDALLHVTHVFPKPPGAMSNWLFVVASAYRAVFTVCGGFVTARIAPHRPMRHVWILCWTGFVAGLAGVSYYYLSREKLGPAWYPFSLAFESIPCVWLGGRVAMVRNQRQRTT